ncbi:MAG: hypothetical protein N2Z74_08410, partial [Syntrophales bacterium]|nr:hypothetical protein [Syntrophales bacterium]
AYIAARGGTLLTPFEKGCKRLKIRCIEGHKWETTIHNLLCYNAWCPKCSYKYRAYQRKLKTWNKVVETIKKMKGTLITTMDTFEGVKGKVTFTCPKGHTVTMCTTTLITKGVCKKCDSRAGRQKVDPDLIVQAFDIAGLTLLDPPIHGVRRTKYRAIDDKGTIKHVYAFWIIQQAMKKGLIKIYE